ncbi:MAG TPA: sialate O-acetylesterase [Opitutae bacterium]|nr:sialate O-acetylesterase [Opitutae bacterium]
MPRIVSFVFLGLWGQWSAFADLQPAKIFSDHMVLQRDAAVPVWGWADADTSVTVAFADQSITTKADEGGRWKLKLDPMVASATGRSLEISSGTRKVTIRDVLVGDVWFAGGQSNMDYRVQGMARRLPEGKALAEAANYSAIRHRKVSEKSAPRPQADLTGGGWVVCTRQSVYGFSGVAFVFARRLHVELKVPVGIIDCAWGGTPIEPYIPASAFKGHPTLVELAKYAKAGDLEAIRKMSGGTWVRSPAWLPGAIYNGRIAPVAPYGIRGAIWYQAESNSGKGEDPRAYRHKQRALVEGWRKAFQQERLPFYFVQLPQWKSYAWTYAREEQLRAMEVAGTGMVVTIDLDNANDIHPPNKIDVGERLALWPLAKLYGKKIPFSGPLFREVEIRGSEAIVRFDYAEEGLIAGRIKSIGKIIEVKDGDLNGFELADMDGVWHPAKANVKGRTVSVKSLRVSQPLAVRYACHPEAPEGSPWNLYGKSGLPTSPFCSDWGLMPYDPAENPMR